MKEPVSKEWTLGRRPDIAIIGAGVAGLRCADLLLMAGAQVTLYEGKNVVGGRVHQVAQGQHYVDMYTGTYLISHILSLTNEYTRGANWIHGVEDNPIVDIAEEVGTPGVSIGEEVAVYSEYGCEMKGHDKDRADQLLAIMWKLIDDGLAYSKACKGGTLSATMSLKDFMGRSVYQRKDLDAEDKEILLQMAEQWGHFAGLPIEYQSLKYFWMEQNIEGDNLFVASSYKAILERIARKALAKARLNLGLPYTVTKITTKMDDDPLSVVVNTHCSRAEYDAVVVAIPLGALKRNRPEFFSPPLPADIQQAINQLGYGCLEKAYLTFPSAWWRREGEGEGETPPTPTPAMMQFLHPQYDPHNPGRSIVDVMDLSLLPAEEGAAHPTLMFYFHGDFARQTVLAYEAVRQAARRVDRTKPIPRNREEKANQKSAAFVTDRFQPYYKLLPNYDPSDANCVPTAATMTSWSADHLAGCGAYTNFPISWDDAALDEHVGTIRGGLSDRCVFFAGEHCAPIVAVGTVTGAYWSGEHAAEQVLAKFQVDSFSEMSDTSDGSDMSE